MSQFPPSSPLLHSEQDDIRDTFDAITKQQHATNTKTSFVKLVADRDERAYLTPDPSSSIGNTTINSESNDAPSSPSLGVKRAASGEIDVTRPLSPSNFHNVINVPLNGDVFKIGRSSLSCSFKLNSSNKLISRIHAQIHYDAKTHQAIIECLGHNGLNITVPESISVHKLYEKTYSVTTGEDLDETDDEGVSASSHVLSQTKAYTNFYMLAGETVHMPLITGTVLDFRGELALLIYDTDKITIDPQTQEITRTPYTPNPRRLSTEQLTKIVEQKKLKFSRHPKLHELEKKRLTTGENSTARPIERKDLSNTIIYKNASPSPSPASAPIKIFEEDTESRIAVSEKTAKEKTPLSDVSTNIKPTMSVDTNTSLKPASIITESRSGSPTPTSTATEEMKKRGRPKKMKQTEEESLRNMPQSEISSILETVPMLEDLSNLITNHIAYSRILQTPFANICELNAVKKHQLSKQQLRCVLIHHIASVGVIFRQGKDAAGKPLDEEYYYIPEQDSDKQRVQLVEELKGSSSQLRSCRKTHKQYFWKKPKI